MDIIPADVCCGIITNINSITAIIIALLAGIFVRFYQEELFKVKEYTPEPPEIQEGGP